MKWHSFRVLDFRIPLQQFQTHENVVDSFQNQVPLFLCNSREQEPGLIGVVSQEKLTNPVFPLRRGDVLPSQRGEDELPDRTHSQPIGTLRTLSHRPSYVRKPNSPIPATLQFRVRGIITTNHKTPAPPIFVLHPRRQRLPLSILLVELVADPVRSHEIASAVSVPEDSARSDPFDVAFQSFG